jgi:hypothetical protein
VRRGERFICSRKISYALFLSDACPWVSVTKSIGSVFVHRFTSLRRNHKIIYVNILYILFVQAIKTILSVNMSGYKDVII